MKDRIMALATVSAVWFTAPAPGQTPPARSMKARPPVVVKVSEGGFRWADAAIGAAAASGTALAVAGLAMVRRERTSVAPHEIPIRREPGKETK